MRKSLDKFAASPLCMTLTIFLATSISGVNTSVCAQTEDKVVAVVGGRKITEKELDQSVTAQLFPLEQQMFAIRKAALENLVLRTILEAEAKKQGQSVEELRKQLTAGKVEVSPGELEKVYAENASVFAAMSPDEARERLRLDLETQARMKLYRGALSELKTHYPVELLLEEPRLPSISVATAPSIGAKEAKVTIVEFSDFQCPYCRATQGTLKQILKIYGNEVRLVFKHLPLDIHADAFASARAAVCAGEQDLFWPYHDALFAAEVLSPEALNKIALDVGLKMPLFRACLSADTSPAAVQRDAREATQLGINSTPTFIVNGRLIRGALDFEEFKTIIEQELKSAHKSPMQ